MTELIWDGKYKDGMNLVGDRPTVSTEWHE